MADPVSLLIAGVTAAGSLVEGAGAYQAGQYQSKVAAMNAKIAKENADRAIFTGQVEQQQHDLEAGAYLDEQLSAQAASGISIGSRSSAAVRRSSHQLALRDSATIRNNAEVEAYNYKTQAANFEADSRLAKQQARAAFLSSIFDAAGSVIGSAKPTKTAAFRRKPAGRYVGP